MVMFTRIMMPIKKYGILRGSYWVVMRAIQKIVSMVTGGCWRFSPFFLFKINGNTDLSFIYIGNVDADSERIMNGETKILSYQDDDKYRNSDIKVKWERFRLHQLPVLAIAGQVNKFLKRNSFSAFREEALRNTNAMEVAIAAINVIEAVRASDNGLLAAQTKPIFHFIKDCFVYIIKNSEKDVFFSSNHYFFDLLGLLWIAENTDVKTKLPFFMNRLYQKTECLINQFINPDGSQYEGSTFYHKYITDSLLLFLYLNPASRKRERLKSAAIRMYYFCCYASINGRLVGIGDNDSGRILPLPQYFEYDSRDMVFTHMLANRLGFMMPGKIEMQSIHALNCSGNPAFGLAILSSGRWDVAVRCEQAAKGSVRRYIGGHCHNDHLSFTVVYQSSEIFVDSAVYTYVSRDDMRFKNLSVKAHNTACVGDLEPDSIRNDWDYIGRSTFVNLFKVSGHELVGEYIVPFGYRHWRSVSLGNCLEIDDEIELCGANKDLPVCVRFHLAPSVSPELQGAKKAALRTPSGDLILCVSGEVSLQIEDSFYAPEYGLRIPSKQIVAYLSDSGGRLYDVKTMIAFYDGKISYDG